MKISVAGTMVALQVPLGRMVADARPALSRALNHTLAKTETSVVRQVAAQSGLPYGTVKRAMKRYSAAAGGLEGEIKGSGRHLPLKLFGARQTGGGVSAAPWVTRRVFPGTFIVRSKAGHVYRRTGAGRFSIKRLYGPAIPREMMRGEAPDAFENAVRINLPPRVLHELARLLR